MPGTLTFVAPGLPVGAGEIPLVRLERDLLTLTTPELTEADLAWVRRRSHEITDAVGSALPASLYSPDSRVPCFWSAFREAFRTYSAAPQAANELLATKALEASEPERIVVREKVNRDWFSFQGTILEAVRQANEEHGGLAEVTAQPRWRLRVAREVWLQSELGSERIPSLAAWRRVGSLRPASYPPSGSVLCLALGPTTVSLAGKLRAELESGHGIAATALVLDASDWQRAVAEFAGSVIAPHHFGQPRRWRLYAVAPPGEIATSRWVPQALISGGLGRIGLYAFLAARQRLGLVLRTELPRVSLALQQAKRLMDRVQPSAVVSFHLYGHMLAPFVLEARARGIPVICVQHGVYLAKDRCLEPMEYDLNCVFGPASAEMFAGRPGETVVVGQPQYRAAPLNGAARPDGPPTILVATQPPRPEDGDGGQPDRWLRGVVDAAEALGARVVIKPHPAETDLAEYEVLAREHPDCVRLLNADAATIAELLRTSEVLVTKDSTVVFDAAMAGVPAVTVNLTGRRDRFPFAEDGGAVGVYRFEDIEPALSRLLRDPAARAELAATREAFLDRHIGCRDGNAIARIAERIAGLVRRSAP